MASKSRLFAKVYVFNVGNGDSMAIELVDGDRLIVIDSSARSKANPTGPAPLLRLLAGRRRRDVDLLCLSHPDWDHARGMDEFVKAVIKGGGEVFRFLTVPFSWKQVEDGFRTGKKGKKGKVPAKIAAGAAGLAKLEEQILGLKEEGRLVDLRHEVGYGRIPGFDELQLVGPSPATVGMEASQYMRALRRYAARFQKLPRPSSNGMSLALLLRKGAIDALFGADAPLRSFQKMISDFCRITGQAAIRPKWIKLPHHGARGCARGQETGWADVWSSLCVARKATARKTKFAIHCVVSAAGTTEHHPCAEFLDELEGGISDLRLYCTNLCSLAKGPTGLPTLPGKRPPLPASAVRGLSSPPPFAATRRGAKTKGSSKRLPTAYHGDMCFSFYTDGRVEAITQHPGTPYCSRHK